MQILLNGEPLELTAAQSVGQVLEALDDLPGNYAIALNDNFVPRSAYADTPIKDGDQLELLVPMQGG